MPRWLPRVLARIRRLAVEGKVQFTAKAFEELRVISFHEEPDNEGEAQDEGQARSRVA